MTVVKATWFDVEALAPRLRPADVAEIAASSGRTPEQSLIRGFHLSKRVWAARVGGQCEAVFGVAEYGRDGCAWLLGSEWLESRAARRPLIKLGRQYVGEMSEPYERLYNYVDCRNERSINWLLHLGFRVDSIIPEFGVGKLPFVLMVKTNV